VSRLVSTITGVLIARNKAVVGENVVGKDSSRQVLRERLQVLGFELDEAEFNRVFSEFKALAERKQELFDGDIEALVLRVETSAGGPWELKQLRINSSSGPEGAQATICLSHRDGRLVEHAARGDGPVDAAFRALEAASGVSVTLRKFEVRAVTEGQDAQGEAVVHVEYQNRSYRGASASTDIVEAGTRALLEVINRIELTRTTSPQRSAALVD
jgi:2-isopropylmalate synthase